MFEIVQGLLEIQHLTEKNLYSQRLKLHSEHRGQQGKGFGVGDAGGIGVRWWWWGVGVAGVGSCNQEPGSPQGGNGEVWGQGWGCCPDAVPIPGRRAEAGALPPAQGSPAVLQAAQPAAAPRRPAAGDGGKGGAGGRSHPSLPSTWAQKLSQGFAGILLPGNAGCPSTGAGTV